MPYDTNGNYTLPTIYYAVSGTIINPAQHNTPFEDVRAALNRALLRDGTAPMTGNLNANSNRITGLAKGTADNDAVTLAQLGGYLSLSTGGDITGKLTISNQPVVVGSSSDHSNYITTITYDTKAGGTGAFSYQDGTGKWRYAQPLGDYATSAQLTAETERATTIESNLQSSKYDKAGGNIAGNVTVTGAAGVSANYDPGGQVSDAYVNYAPILSVAGGRGGNFGFYVQELVGSYFSGVIVLQQNDKTVRFLVMPGSPSKRLNDSVFGEFAHTSDLGNYVPSSTYVADFSTSDSRVTNLPYGQREVSFNVLITSNGQYVPFPEAFTSTPVSIICGDCGNDAGKTDAWPICAPLEKCTAAGCNVYIGSAAVPRRVSIIAKGSR